MCKSWKRSLPKIKSVRSLEKKEIIKMKVTEKITYPETRQLYELVLKPVYSKIVQSSVVKPPTKTTSTPYDKKMTF